MGKKAETTEQVFARRLKALRARKGWTTRELAGRLAEQEGVQISHATITKLEKGDRQRIGVAELFAFAAVFGVSPTFFVTTGGYDDPIQLTPNTQIESHHMWQWVSGQRPLREDWSWYFRLVPPEVVHQHIERAANPELTEYVADNLDQFPEIPRTVIADGYYRVLIETWTSDPEAAAAIVRRAMRHEPDFEWTPPTDVHPPDVVTESEEENEDG